MQGRMHDLSEGGARIITEKKIQNLEPKDAAQAKIFFDNFFCFALGFLYLKCY